MSSINLICSLIISQSQSKQVFHLGKNWIIGSDTSIRNRYLVHISPFHFNTAESHLSLHVGHTAGGRGGLFFT